MAETSKLLQLRIPPALYDALTREAARRQRAGEPGASRNRVAVDWLTAQAHTHPHQEDA